MKQPRLLLIGFNDITYNKLPTTTNPKEEYDLVIQHPKSESKVNVKVDMISDLADISDYTLTQLWLNKIRRTPMISVFTTSYKSGDKILRPYRSLLKQTFMDWEWVVFDDSPELPSNFEQLTKFAQSDKRIRVFRSDRNSGLIGNTKDQASRLCRGKYLLELDHDDTLLPNSLQIMYNAFEETNADFVCSDCCEIYEKDESNHSYGDIFGFGYAGHYYQWSSQDKRWYCVATVPHLNPTTIRYIVGIPNHFRAWRTSFFLKIGGYNPYINVADDYDLFVRTFLETDKIIRVPDLHYIQYKNRGGNNFTTIRNEEIQRLTIGIADHYNDRIKEQFDELGIEDYQYGKHVHARPCWKEWKYEPRVEKLY